MSNVNEQRWLIELLWWSMTALAVVLVILPFFLYQISFKFLIYNIAFVIVAFTFTRMIFFLESHPLQGSKLFKIGMIFIIPIIFFPIVEGLHSFIEFNDRVGLQTILGHLNPELQAWLRAYIRSEYLLFGVTSMITSFLIIIKMLRSIRNQIKFSK